MSDMVEVFESDERYWVEEVMGALQEEGLHPELKDDAGAAYYRREKKSPGVLGMPPGRMKVCVVVPRQEEAAARSFLQKRAEQSASSVAELTGKLWEPLGLSLFATLVAFIMMTYFLGQPGPCLLLSLICVFPASFIVAANPGLFHGPYGLVVIVIVTVAAFTGGIYCLEKGQAVIGALLIPVPVAVLIYIGVRAYKNRSRRN